MHGIGRRAKHQLCDVVPTVSTMSNGCGALRLDKACAMTLRRALSPLYLLL